MRSFRRWIRFARSSRASLILAFEVVLGILVCFLSLYIFVHLTQEMLEKEYTTFDLQFSGYVYSLRTPFLTFLMKTVTALGASVTVIAGFLICALMFMKKHRKEALLFIVTLLMGLVLNSSFKSIVARPRPFLSPLVQETSYSFPSGHAMNSFVFYFLLAYFSYHFFHSKKLTYLASLVAFVLVLLIGFSRIYLGVHYPSDVIAGYIAGFWWLVTILVLEHTLIFFRRYKRSE